jgi:hypothetical protein
MTLTQSSSSLKAMKGLHRQKRSVEHVLCVTSVLTARYRAKSHVVFGAGS